MKQQEKTYHSLNKKYQQKKLQNRIWKEENTGAIYRAVINENSSKTQKRAYIYIIYVLFM